MAADTNVSEDEKKTAKIANAGPGKPGNPNTIAVDKTKLDQLLAELEVLKASDSKKTQDIEKLLAIADKARGARYDDLTKAAITHTYRVRVYKGQVVVGWRLAVDEMFKDGNGIWHERQQVEIVLENGDKYTLAYLDSERIQKVTTEHVATETRVENGEEVTVFTLRMEDGREFKINKTFVN